MKWPHKDILTNTSLNVNKTYILDEFYLISTLIYTFGFLKSGPVSNSDLGTS